VVDYKARLVVKGFHQREGIDYDELYAPTVDKSTLRLFLSIVAVHDLELHQLDVRNAFVNASLKHTIHIQHPPGHDPHDGTCLLLHKALSGLKQSPHEWHEHLRTALQSLGFTVCHADPALFVLEREGNLLYLLVHVDDMLLASSSLPMVTAVKAEIAGLFKVRDLGEASVFLGIRIQRDRKARTLRISQPLIVQDLIIKYDLAHARPTYVPLNPAEKLVREGELCDDVQLFQELLGSCLYLSMCTRPELAHAVGVLARFMIHPTRPAMRALMHLARHVATTPDLGIVYGPKGELHAYTDSSFADDESTRRSTTGFYVSYGGGAVDWRSTLQRTIALSSTEAEYMAASACVRDVLWIRMLMRELRLPVACIPIMADNQSCQALMKREAVKQRSKHIDIIYHHARDQVRRGIVAFKHVGTAAMYADCLTKAVPQSKFDLCRYNMGMRMP
jgi:hypothetical protein